MHQHLGARASDLPQFLGDERHDRVQQDQALVQHPFHRRLRFRLGGGIVALKQGFGELHVPVADLAPDKAIQRLRRVVEAVGRKRRVHLFADLGGFADDPFIQGFGLVPAGRSRPSNPTVHFAKAEAFHSLVPKLR